jgi:hypothetical protein
MHYFCTDECFSFRIHVENHLNSNRVYLNRKRAVKRGFLFLAKGLDEVGSCQSESMASGENGRPGSMRTII